MNRSNKLKAVKLQSGCQKRQKKGSIILGKRIKCVTEERGLCVFCTGIPNNAFIPTTKRLTLYKS